MTRRLAYDHAMTEPLEPGEPRPSAAGGTPRRLERPPGERYATGRATTIREPSTARAIVRAGLVALAGAILMILLAGQLAVSSGLLVLAVLVGRFVGLAIRTARGASSPGRSRLLAVVIALAGVAIAQVGMWLYARSEGGVLQFGDYLGQTFGPLVPLEILLAAVVALLSAD
jgi:hypothetical protein